MSLMTVSTAKVTAVSSSYLPTTTVHAKVLSKAQHRLHSVSIAYNFGKFQWLQCHLPHPVLAEHLFLEEINEAC